MSANAAQVAASQSTNTAANTAVKGGMRGGTAALWGLMAFLSVGVGAYALFHAATGMRFLNLGNGFPTPLGLYTHIAASGVALMVGPFQFLPGLRGRRPSLHRWMGRTYVAACLIGGAAGGAIAMFSAAGPIAGVGFLSLAVLWLVFTGLALAAVLRRDFRTHERWMIRSFALTFAAVTLRLYLPAGIILADGEFTTPYRIIAWAAWVPNLLLVEAFLRARPRPSARLPA